MIRPLFIQFLIAGFLWMCENPEEKILVDIPDRSFLQGLINAGIDTDKDGKISTLEAKATRSILIPPSGIRDLTGLEAFVNLDSFSITLNSLAGIDLSANTRLRYLKCTSCDLASLDVSSNPALEEIICGRNQLEDLDVSQNRSLLRLSCNNNLLEDLDLSENTNLVKLISCGNQLTSLDLSKNASLKIIGFDNMPMLTEVCVWTLPFPPSGVTTLQEYSPNVSFTADCSGK